MKMGRLIEKIKKDARRAVLAAAVVAAAAAGSFAWATHAHMRSLKKQVAAGQAQIERQNAVIDSLVRMPRMGITLWVTDNSRSKINGRSNRGYIRMDNGKRYVLDADSVSVVRLKRTNDVQ